MSLEGVVRIIELKKQLIWARQYHFIELKSQHAVIYCNAVKCEFQHNIIVQYFSGTGLLFLEELAKKHVPYIA